jgi:cell division septal protein FtsQ
MPRKRKIKRKRTRLKPGPILWLLVVVNLIVGLLFSPMTAATTVDIEGARGSDRQRLQRDLQWIQGQPALRADRRGLIEQIYRRPDVRSVEFSQNLLGKGSLKIVYHQPVATLAGVEGVALTEAGTLVATPDIPEGLPVIEPFPEALAPNLALGANWDPRKVADLCRRAAAMPQLENLVITVESRLRVCLNSKNGRVVLGSADQLNDKFEKLEEILGHQPNLLSPGKELNLTAPAKPVTRLME